MLDSPFDVLRDLFVGERSQAYGHVSNLDFYVPSLPGWSLTGDDDSTLQFQNLCSLAVGDIEPEPAKPLSVRGRLRVGDRGKELAAGLLQRAFAKGQLSKDELEHRLSVVLEARVRNDLRPALEDLEEYQLVRTNPRRWQYWLD